MKYTSKIKKYNKVAVLSVFVLMGQYNNVHAKAAAVTPPVIKFQKTQLPRPTGKYAVGFDSSLVVDRNRIDIINSRADQPRRIPVSFWYPTNKKYDLTRKYLSDVRASSILDSPDLSLFINAVDFLKTNTFNLTPVAKGSFPLILLSHGYGFSPESYQVYAEEIASQGYIVVGVNSLGISGTNVVDGEVYPLYPPAEQPSQQAVLNTQLVEDLKSVLAQIKDGRALPSFKLGQAIDLTKIGVMGHSFGGSASVRLAGEMPEIIAAVNLDGFIFAPAFDIQKGFKANVLFVVSSNPAEDLATAPAQFRENVILNSFQRLQGRGYLVFQKNVEHITYTDSYYLARTTKVKVPGFSLTDFGKTPEKSILLSKKLVVEYFNVEIKKKNSDKLNKLFSNNKADFEIQKK
jgi:dienelactone hydrolase